MDEPSTAIQEDEQPYLFRQLQKFLHIYTDQDESRTQMMLHLRTCNEQLFGQVAQFKNLCLRIQLSLQKTHLPSKSNASQVTNEEIDFVKQMPLLAIKEVMILRNTNENSISNVANKLKTFVSKTMQKQSSKLRYNYNSFISQSIQEVNDFAFAQTFQKMKEEFSEIRRKYKVIKESIVIMHRYHPTSFLKYGGNADFYVSFYVESLLFFQDNPLPFNGNLLFAPLSLVKIKNKQSGRTVHISINNWYIKQLSKEDANWQSHYLQIIFWDTSKQKIKHYACINFQKKGLQNQTISLLRKIRCFVYFKLLFNYLNFTLSFNDLSHSNNSINLKLNDKIMLEINLQKQVNDRKMVNDSQIIRDFLKYFDEQNIKKRQETNRQQVTSNLQNYFLCLMNKYKYNANISQEYIKLKPKYFYIGDKRMHI